MDHQQVQFVYLQDGRRIAYRELGCSSQDATRSLLILHGVFSSRLFAIPGISEALLVEFGVRLIAIDRPGYGQSDPDPSQTLFTSSQDVERIIDELHLGEQVWLLGYSLGGMYCWAAARYIPHRLAGIALWAPAGNFYWKSFSKQESKAIQADFSAKGYRALRSLYFRSRNMPFFSFRRYVGDLCKQLVAALHSPEALIEKDLSLADQKALQRSGVLNFMLSDRVEAMGGFNNGFGIAKDFELFSNNNWGFELEELGKGSWRGRNIHIWHGEDDHVVPWLLQKLIKRELPGVVELHHLQAEGHYSWYYFNEAAHRLTFTTLFQQPGFYQNKGIIQQPSSRL